MSRSSSKNKKARFQRILREVKAVPCKDCGRHVPGQMTFDHIDPSTKKFTIAHGWYKSVQTLLAEIAKCEVVCGSCHRMREKRRGVMYALRSRMIEELRAELSY